MYVEAEKLDFILGIFPLQVTWQGEFGRVFMLLNIFEFFFFFCIHRGGWAVIRSILGAPVYLIYLPVFVFCFMTSPVYIATITKAVVFASLGLVVFLSEL